MNSYALFTTASNRLVALAGLLASSSLLVSCSPTYLLFNDFRTESVGTKPAKNIPGDPQGDAVEYISAIESRLAVVDFPQTSSEKGLAFSSKPVNLGSGNFSTSYLNFKGINTTDFSKKIQYSLVGKFDNFQDKLLVDFTNGQAGVFTRLQLNTDGSVVVTESFSATSLPPPICRLKPNVIYFMTFTVDMAQNTCRIFISGDLTINGEKQNNVTKTVNTITNQLSSIQGPINPSVSFNWLDPAFGNSKFTLTGVQIRR